MPVCRFANGQERDLWLDLQPPEADSEVGRQPSKNYDQSEL